MVRRLAAMLAALACLAHPAPAQPAPSRAEALGERARIVTLLRSRRMMEEAQARADLRGRASEALSWRAFPGDLAEVLAIDGPRGPEYATMDDLRDLNIGVRDAWALAPRNVPERLGALRIEALGGDGLVRLASDGQGFAPTALRGEACMVAGPAAVIALVLGPREFLFADLDAPDAEARFLRATRAVIAEGLSMSQTPIRCRDGFWEAVSLSP